MSRRVPASLLAASLALALLPAPAPAETAAPASSVKVTPGPPVVSKTPAPTAPPAAPNGAKLVLEQPAFDAGTVMKGEAIKHDFVVKNTGTGDLMLEVKPQCGCTLANFDKVVAPGATGKISLSVDTTRFKGATSKSATLTSNDPANASIQLTIRADIKTFVDVNPSPNMAIRQYRGEETKQSVTISGNEAEPLKILEVKASNEWIRHELVPPVEGSKAHTLTAWLDPKAPIGSVEGSLKVLTNSTKEPQIDIVVHGSVLGQIAAEPSTLFFRVAGPPPAVAPKAADGDLTKIVNVNHRQHSTFRITGTSVKGKMLESGALAVKVLEPGPDPNAPYRIEVTYAGTLPTGNHTGELVLQTTDEREPEVKVPLYVVVS